MNRPCFLLLALIVASPLGAQSRDTSALRAAAVSLRPAQKIRIALDANRWVGRFHRLGGDTVFFGPTDQPPMAVRFSAVDTLWREQSGAGTGAKVGAVAGGVVVGFAVMLASGLAGAEGSQSVRPQHITAGLLGAALGAGAGALAGSAIGRGFRGWKRLYP